MSGERLGTPARRAGLRAGVALAVGVGTASLALAIRGAPAPQAPGRPPVHAADAHAGHSVHAGGHQMRPVDPGLAPGVDADARGNEPLPAEVDARGVKVFRLTAGVVRWPILPDVEVTAYAFNEQVPGPLIRVTQGDRLRVHLRNDLPEPTSVHWHGMRVPNEHDGAVHVTQKPIPPGGTFTYEFTAIDAGTYWYHSHMAGERQQPLGLYGVLIVDPRDGRRPYDRDVLVVLGEWTVKDGSTYPAMDADGLRPNYFTINGKAYPATERVALTVGQRVRIRFVGAGQFVHPMHLHGQPFEIVETDGNPVPPGGRLRKDTVLVAPGERYDVEFVADRKGRWLLHCHIGHHLTNDGHEVDGGGGLTMLVEVS